MLSRIAGFCFIVLIVSLPWFIAGMSIAAALSVATTLGVWLWGSSGGSGVEPEVGPWTHRLRTPLLGPGLFWFLAMVVAAAFALDPGSSFRRVTKGLVPLLVPMAAFHTSRRPAGERAVTILLVSGTIAAGLGLTTYLASGAAYPARARGPSGHYMTFAGQLLLLLPVAVGVLVAGARRLRLPALASVLVGGAALVATYTRSAWLGFAVALGVMFSIARPRWVPGLVLGLGLLWLVAPATVRERASSAFDPSHPTNRERTYMWRAGLQMFLDHPLTGIGLQDLKPIYDRYRPAAARERAGHLHSVPVQIAATMGAIGLAAFVILYGTLIGMAAAGLRGQLARGDPGAGIRLGMVGGLAGFLVAGFFEWNFGDEELLYLLYTLAGIAWAARNWSAVPGRSEAAP